MGNKIFKSLALIIMAVIFRSIHLHQDFYNRIWEENQFTVVFLGIVFTLVIFVISRYEKFENASED